MTTLHTFTCPNPDCKKVFKATYRKAKYCSRSCASHVSNQKVDRSNTGRPRKESYEPERVPIQRPPAVYSNQTKVFEYYIARI